LDVSPERYPRNAFKTELACRVQLNRTESVKFK